MERHLRRQGSSYRNSLNIELLARREPCLLYTSFAEFKELKNIDRATLMRVLEDIFRNMLIKRYGTDENFDIIINIDKGDLEIWRNRIVVEDDAFENPNTQMSLTEAKNCLLYTSRCV